MGKCVLMRCGEIETLVHWGCWEWNPVQLLSQHGPAAPRGVAEPQDPAILLQGIDLQELKTSLHANSVFPVEKASKQP